MGKLFVVSTPIGNLEDITIRAIKTLFSVDYILCEDTRKTGVLRSELEKRYLGVIKQYNNVTMKQCTFIRFDDTNEVQKTPEIVEILDSGMDIALVSNAGTPLISDPGYKLVQACLARDIPVISIPGPSAILAALTSSGLPTNSFTFLGFPPDKPSKQKRLFSSIKSLKTQTPRTYIMYISPHKLKRTLDTMHEVFGNHHVTLARELTKIHEEIWSGAISAAKNHFKHPKGEFVLLFNV